MNNEDPAGRYGPNWEQVLTVLDRARTVTPDQLVHLARGGGEGLALDKAATKAGLTQWTRNAVDDVWVASRHIAGHRYSDRARYALCDAAAAAVLADALTGPRGELLHRNATFALQPVTP